MNANAKVKELTPPDMEQCQVDVPNGHSFMTMGGKYGGKVRCEKKPIYIVEDKIPGKDGLCGSMSMCPECFLQFMAQGNSVSKYKVVTIGKEG